MTDDGTTAGTETHRAERTRTVTLLFADIEGSTRLLAELGADYDDVLAHYYRIVRDETATAGGDEVTTEGDGYFAVIHTASAAVAAAVGVQQRLAETTWPGGVEVRARIGLHTGEATEGPGGPVGLDVHRAARIASAGHGGQVLLSDAVRILAQHHFPEDVGLVDLGSHRLKDFSEPERIYQLTIAGLPSDFAPLRTLGAAPNNLPERLTSFVGRGADLTALATTLDENRLVTLTGPGGTGKTRLALQTAASVLERFPDGAWFVELAPIRDPLLVPAAVIRALRLRETPSLPLREQLLEHLRDKRMLLVLDNFEQVLDAATLVTEVLRAAPHTRVLVTSRAPLHVSGEQEFPVRPLGVPGLGLLPSPESMAQYEAVELFVQRATAARSQFAVTNENAPAVAELVSRLDGLPLAIELAAARVKMLTPEQMLDRLNRRLGGLGTAARDVPQRQQTLRDTIAWSYELLGESERTLLASLSVFVGGWTLDGAERVCGQNMADADVLDALAALVDHSLVRQHEDAGDIRFDMLETIRDFASERLDEMPGAEALRDRHAAEYLELAEGTAKGLHGPTQAECLVVLERERANLRAALDRFQTRGDTPTAVLMGASLWRFWQKTSVQEGQERIGRLLAMADDVPDELRSQLLEAAGGIAYWRGDMDQAIQSYEETLAIARELDDPRGIANALCNLALPRLIGKDDQVAPWDLAQEALDLYTELGDEAGMVKARWTIGAVAYFAGRYDVAEREMSASLVDAERIGDLFHANWARHLLAANFVKLKRLEEARRLATEALHYFAKVGDHSAVPLLLDDFSEIAAGEGKPERHVRLGAASLALQQRSGVELARMSAEIEGRVPVDREAFAAAWDEGRRMDEETAIAYALAEED